jgi:trimethylamine---corrinoid protein Co-methyltransferase
VTAATFVNRMPRYEILSEDAMAVLEGGWRRLVSEIGVRFDHPRAHEVFRAAGQDVEDDVVRLDPDFVLEQVALAPREFVVAARNPERAVEVGGDRMCFMAVQGPPFVREGATRREATMADLERFIKLSQVFDEIDLPGSVSCEPGDLPLDSRHLDMVRAALVLSDKPLVGSQISLDAARDSLELARIVLGDELDRSPCVFSNINVNSPLHYDGRMLDSLFVYASAGQPILITPFLLMGAMSPVTIPSALVQQLAEALAGVALAQLVRPGTPVVLGSFLSHTDMQSGSPGFGGPEAATGLLCSGQLARRFGLPWRSGGGGLTTSQTVDAQAAYESLNTMLPAFLAGANIVLHAAGWLESGLVSCYEKYIVDIELLRMLRHEFTPLEIDEASLAFDAHDEVRHGGHFLGAAHTLERFRDCFYRPLLSSTENFERWSRGGALDATSRAEALWRQALDRYEQPPLDSGTEAELAAYVARRRRELGD